MNWIQVNKQDLLRLHSGYHGDLIVVVTKFQGKYELNTA